MRRLILLLLLAACTLPPNPGKAGILIPEQQMPKWAAEPNQFQLDQNEAEIGSTLEIAVGPADFSWGIAYVYTDNKIWEKIIINPLLTKDKIVQQWVKGTAKFTLAISPGKFTPGKTYYVIGYWCNKGIKWKCNDNKWMLISFKTKEKPAQPIPKSIPPPKPTPTPTPAMQSEIINIEEEISQLEKELDELDNEEGILDELP